MFLLKTETHQAISEFPGINVLVREKELPRFRHAVGINTLLHDSTNRPRTVRISLLSDIESSRQASILYMPTPNYEIIIVRYLRCSRYMSVFTVAKSLSCEELRFVGLLVGSEDSIPSQMGLRRGKKARELNCVGSRINRSQVSSPEKGFTQLELMMTSWYDHHTPTAYNRSFFSSLYDGFRNTVNIKQSIDAHTELARDFFEGISFLYFVGLKAAWKRLTYELHKALFWGHARLVSYAIR